MIAPVQPALPESSQVMSASPAAASPGDGASFIAALDHASSTLATSASGKTDANLLGDSCHKDSSSEDEVKLNEQTTNLVLHPFVALPSVPTLIVQTAFTPEPVSAEPVDVVPIETTTEIETVPELQPALAHPFTSISREAVPVPSLFAASNPAPNSWPLEFPADDRLDSDQAIDVAISSTPRTDQRPNASHPDTVSTVDLVFAQPISTQASAPENIFEIAGATPDQPVAPQPIPTVDEVITSRASAIHEVTPQVRAATATPASGSAPIPNMTPAPKVAPSPDVAQPLIDARSASEPAFPAFHSSPSPPRQAISVEASSVAHSDPLYATTVSEAAVPATSSVDVGHALTQNDEQSNRDSHEKLRTQHDSDPIAPIATNLMDVSSPSPLQQSSNPASPIPSPHAAPPQSLQHSTNTRPAATVLPDATTNTLQPSPTTPGIKILDDRGDAEMNFSVDTSAFGSVRVHTVVRDGDVGVTLTGERGNLTPLISSELPALQATLHNHDLRLESVRVYESTGLATSSGSSQQESRQHHASTRSSVSPQQSETCQMEPDDELSALYAQPGTVNIHV